jgi:hypothetical protein
MDDTKFTITAATPRHIADSSGGDAVGFQQNKQAYSLGMNIAKKKGWKIKERDGIIVSTLEIYVFTRDELKEFLKDRSHCTHEV